MVHLTTRILHRFCAESSEARKKRYHIDCSLFFSFVCVYNFRSLSLLLSMSVLSLVLLFFLLDCLCTKDEESSPFFSLPLFFSVEKKRRKPHLANGRPRYDWLCQAQVIYDTKRGEGEERNYTPRGNAAKEPLFMQEWEKNLFVLQ